MNWMLVFQIWTNVRKWSSLGLGSDPYDFLLTILNGLHIDPAEVESIWYAADPFRTGKRLDSFEKILKMKALIDGEEFETPARVLGTIDILQELLNCPPGDGTAFERVTELALCRSLSYIVDQQRVRRKYPCPDGFIDIVLPLRLEILEAYSLWSNWCRRFNLRSLVVEAKNTDTSSGYSNVGQILHYLNRAKLGNVGLLVSRNGFTESAMKDLHGIALDNKQLIIPLDQSDLERLLVDCADSPCASMQLLREKETDLLHLSAR